MYFEIFVLLLKHFGVPALFLFWLWKRDYKSIIDWLVMVFLTGAYVSFIYFTGEWHWFGYYFRYLIVLLFGIAIAKSFLNARKKPLWVAKDPREKFGFVFTLFFMMIFLGLSVWAYWGTRIDREGVSLDFPLKHGRYFIIHGGNSPLLSQHHRPFQSPLKYAVDITKFFPGGVRAKGLYPDRLSDYAIYGDSLFSPCSGVIISVVDGLPDQKPSEIDTSAMNVAGNSIIIQNDSLYVLLGHLMPGSIRVQVGDTVHTGQFLARVGNSGYTTEPHLHIHVSRGSPKVLLEGEGIPVLFNHRFLVRNDMIDIP